MFGGVINVSKDNFVPAADSNLQGASMRSSAARSTAGAIQLVL